MEQGSGNHRFSGARRSLGAALAVSALGLAGLPAAASADGVPPIMVGPIAVHHGYYLTIQAGCGKFGYISVNYEKSAHHVLQSHTYSAGKPKICKASKNLSSARLKGPLPGGGRINVTLSRKGQSYRSKPPAGCRGKGPLVQRSTAHGTIKVSTAKVFGKLNTSTARALLESATSTLHCSNPPGFKKEKFLYGNFGTVFLSAVQPAKGARSVSIGESTKSAYHSITFTGGKSIFSVPNSLNKATIAGLSPQASGKLTFVSNPPCSQYPGVRSGHFTGKLVIRMDATSKLTLVGNSASFGQLTKGNAYGNC